MTGGHTVLVDECDLAAVSAHRWHLHSRGYAVRNVRSGRRYVPLFMHRVIMCPPPGLTVDHINGNPLDNRRANLRICSQRDNSRNTSPRTRPGQTSRFKGVRMHPKRRKWEAYIRVSGVQKYLGHFPTEEAAAEAYNRAAAEFFGAFAQPNAL